MNYFKYKSISESGKLSSGIIYLPYNDIMSATNHLENEGNIVVKITKTDSLSTLILDLKNNLSKKKLKRTYLAEFLRNMSMMLKAGLPLITVLKETSSSPYQPNFEKDMKEIIATILKGLPFSETAKKYNHIFPPTVVHLIRIGEETGRLDEMLLKGSEHIARIHQILSDTKQALMYPSFVFTAIGLGFFFWFYAVVPKILELFKEMNVELPTITQIIMNISYFVQDNILYIGTFIPATIFILMTAYKSNKFFKFLFDKLLLKLPLASTIINASNLAFITQYLSLLLGAGIDLVQSINILKESVNNEVFKSKLDIVKDSLTKGEGISESFKNSNIFPFVVVKMISIGEQSGTLNEQLDFVAEDYSQRLSILVASIGKMIEPIVLVVAGGLFAIVIGGLMLPIYDLVSNVSG